MRDGVIPTRDNCDLSNPRERFLWCFTSMPIMHGSILLLPNEMTEALSERISQCGGMLVCPSCGHEEPQEIRWRATPADPGMPFASGVGEWVSADQAESEVDVVAESLAQMKPHVKRLVAERLAGEFPDVFGGDVR